MAKSGNEFVDQGLHALAGALIVSVANVLGADVNPIAGAFIGWSGGLIREITEEDELSLAAFERAVKGEFWLFFWALGGSIGGLTSYIGG